MEYRWGRFSFEGAALRTDILLYKDRSFLMLPSENEENRFMVQSEADRIEFYIGSTSIHNFQKMSSFFSKMYACNISGEKPERIEGEQSYALVNRNARRKTHFTYFPAFIRNLIYMPSETPGMRLQYEVVIRSFQTLGKRRLYNFCTFLNVELDEGHPDEFRSHICHEARMLRKEGNWKLRLVEGPRTAFRSDLLEDPVNLINFVRIPFDEGL